MITKNKLIVKLIHNSNNLTICLSIVTIVMMRDCYFKCLTLMNWPISGQSLHIEIAVIIIIIDFVSYFCYRIYVLIKFNYFFFRQF